MKLHIKSIFFGVIFILMAFGFNACNTGHSEGDGHNHEAADAHEEGEGGAEATVASLTAEQIKTVGITLGSIENRDLTASIRANGTLTVPNDKKANATSLYGGVIKAIAVQLGDQVRKGQLVATIENPQFIQLQEEYLTTASQLILAEQELERQQELHAGNAGVKRNLQQATAELGGLRTRRASLGQQLQLMGIPPANISDANLKNTISVVSPVGGTVSAVTANIGSYVDVSSPIAEIVDNSQLHLDLQVFERDVPRIEVGQQVHFTVTNNPGKSYTATVFSIGASFESGSKNIAVHARIEGDKSGLIDGMAIMGAVSLDDVTTPAVPDDAIVEADGKHYIFIQTTKAASERGGHGHEGHDHGDEADHAHAPGETHDHEGEHEHGGGTTNFEKIEVAKGVSQLGYSAITPVRKLPADTRVVIRSAFFINAMLGEVVGHSH